MFKIVRCTAHAHGLASVSMEWTADPGVEFPVETVLWIASLQGDVIQPVGSMRITLSDEGAFVLTIPGSQTLRAGRIRVGRSPGLVALRPNPVGRCEVNIGGERVPSDVQFDFGIASEFGIPSLVVKAPLGTVERLAEEASADDDHPFGALTTLYGRGWDLHSDHLWLLTDGSTLDAV